MRVVSEAIAAAAPTIAAPRQPACGAAQLCAKASVPPNPISDYDSFCNQQLDLGKVSVVRFVSQSPCDLSIVVAQDATEVIATVMDKIRTRPSASSAHDHYLLGRRGSSDPWCIRLIRYIIKRGNAQRAKEGHMPVSCSRSRC